MGGARRGGAGSSFTSFFSEEYTETGRTFVLSTHIIEEAADVMEEVIILDRGKILLKENTQELVDRARYVTGLADQVDGATAGLPLPPCGEHRPEQGP